jgi:hypothetical protein
MNVIQIKTHKRTTNQMAKMGVSQQEIQDSSNFVSVPGTYTVSLQGFKPKKSKDGNSVNLNPNVVIIGDPAMNGKQSNYSLNFQASTWFMVKSFIHSFGIDVEKDAAGNESIPGDFGGPQYNADDPSTWQYSGPLLGKTAKWEFAETTYNGKVSVKPKQFLCALSGCTEKHPDNLNKS